MIGSKVEKIEILEGKKEERTNITQLANDGFDKTTQRSLRVSQQPALGRDVSVTSAALCDWC